VARYSLFVLKVPLNTNQPIICLHVYVSECISDAHVATDAGHYASPVRIN